MQVWIKSWYCDRINLHYQDFGTFTNGIIEKYHMDKCIMVANEQDYHLKYLLSKSSNSLRNPMPGGLYHLSTAWSSCPKMKIIEPCG